METGAYSATIFEDDASGGRAGPAEIETPRRSDTTPVSPTWSAETSGSSAIAGEIHTNQMRHISQAIATRKDLMPEGGLSQGGLLLDFDGAYN